MLGFADDFPFVAAQPQLIYLDSAATTKLPTAVLAAMHDYYIDCHANAHRASHQRGIAATSALEQSRKRVAAFVNAPAETLAFVSSTTSGLNQLAQSFVTDLNWSVGDEIVVSMAEHHANLLPWQRLASLTGASLRVLPVAATTGKLDVERVDFSPRTRIFACTLASNVTGVTQPLSALNAAAQRVGAVTIVDAAQAAAHCSLDISSLACDALIFSAHKCYGPTGIAALYLSEALQDNLSPWLLGGGIVEQVTAQHADYIKGIRKFEAGTPNVAGAVGFAAAIDWLTETRTADSGGYLADLAAQLANALAQRPWLKLLPREYCGAPIVSFSVAEGYDFSGYDVALALDQQQIAVRSGAHCAQPLLQSWQMSQVVRCSFGLYNTPDQVQRVIAALDQAYEVYR